LGELVKWKILKSIHKKVSRKAGHIRVADRISEAFAGHVWPPARTCPGLTLIPPQLGISDILVGLPRLFPDMSGLANPS
jgi:hypothetical protein